MFELFFRKNEGFSLVEAMSGIVILTIALFPALGYFSNSVQFVHQTEIRSQAMDIAVDTMEYFKMTAKNDWVNINSNANNFSKNELFEFDLKETYNTFVDDYKINVEVNHVEVSNPEVNENVNENVKDITVTVNWNNAKNNVSLSSLLRAGG